LASSLSRRSRFILKLLLALGLSFTAYLFIFHSSFFEIKDVKVKGSSLLSHEALRQNGLLPIGKNIWLISKEAMAFDIEKRWFVKVLSVRRDLPSTLVLEIEDQDSVALVRSQNGLWLMSKRGLLWPVIKVEEDIIKKMASGLCVINYRCGDIIWVPGKEVTDQGLQSLLRLLFVFNLREADVEVDWLLLKLSGYEVFLPKDGDLASELLKLRKVMESFPFRGKTITVDLRFSDMAIVRERDR